VLSRDLRCVYCGVEFIANGPGRRGRPSWEHIVNDELIVTRENIARCCVSCNSSKGVKELAIWLESKYCKEREITRASVAPVVRAALDATHVLESVEVKQRLAIT